MTIKSKESWQYGKSPAPKNWQEAADVLKSINKPKHKGPGLMDRLAAIEKLLQEGKHGS